MKMYQYDLQTPLAATEHGGYIIQILPLHDSSPNSIQTFPKWSWLCLWLLLLLL
jgi:hypothetical protein